MELVGYVDNLSVVPGDAIWLHASSEADDFTSEIVRLFHAGETGPGYKAEVVEGTLSHHVGRFQPIRTGSYLRVPIPRHDLGASGFTFSIWLQPSHLQASDPALADLDEASVAPARWTLAFPPDPVRPQVVVSGSDGQGAGWRVTLDSAGAISLSVDTDDGTATVTCERPLLRTIWYHLVVTIDPQRSELALSAEPQTPLLRGSSPQLTGQSARAQLHGKLVDWSPELTIGGLPQVDEFGKFVGSTFNGKVAGPRLYTGTASAEMLADPAVAVRNAELMGAWDLSRELHSLDIIDVSGHGNHGRAINRPGRGVTGPNWQLGTVSFHDAPEEYGAVSLHDDDLDDAGWDPTIEWTVPAGLASGAYAFRLRDDNGSLDHVPFVVTPPASGPTAKMLLVLPTFSYLAYANEHSLWSTSDQVEDGYLRANRLNGLYDKHLNDPNGDGVMYSSWKRPIMNMRPHYLWKALRGGEGSVHQFGADLHLIDWLHESGYDVDVVTDVELDREGVDLLSQYRVVMTGTHAEYWSRRMLDGLEAYLSAGGRVMYMSGNGLYWVTGLDPELGHTVEIRRALGMSGGWYHKPGEGHLSTTGERGGAWRERALAPQRYVGVGTAAFLSEEAMGRGGPFTFQPGSRDPRAAFIMEGLDGDELLGDFPNLVNGWGPVGYEADRVDINLGTPLHALTIASAHAGTTDVLIPCFEETLSPNARADVAFFETGGGGAVFAAGSISWAGSLHHNHYDNNVAQMTDNVLRRFLSPEPFELPELP